MLTKEESRGTDTKFAKDALVLIIANVDSLTEYQ